MLWIKEVEMVDSVGDIKSSQLFSPFLRCWMRGLCPLWTRSSRIPASRKRSVWRNRKFKKRIGSFAEDRSLTWSTTASWLVPLMIPFLMTLIFSQLLFAMMMFKNSIRDGTKFHYRWGRSHLMMSLKVWTNWEYVTLINSKPYWNFVWPWNSQIPFHPIFVQN